MKGALARGWEQEPTGFLDCSAVSSLQSLLMRDWASRLPKSAQKRVHGNAFLPGVSMAETLETGQAQADPPYQMCLLPLKECEADQQTDRLGCSAHGCVI